MPKKNTALSRGEQLSILDQELKKWLPNLSSWWDNETDFREVRVMSRDDGSMLAIAKGYDGEGGPVVAFGVGYGVAATLLALDTTIQGGRWKFDKYFQP